MCKALILLSAALALIAAVSGSAAADLDPDLFPGIAEQSDEAIRIRGLASLYPGRIHFDDPNAIHEPLRAEAAREESLENGITYLRLYRIEEAARVLNDHRDTGKLIIDMRFLQSESLGGPLLEAFGTRSESATPIAIGESPELQTTVAGEAPSTDAQRPLPVIVLCNARTDGPFEATLALLQSQGRVAMVGAATAGDTGFFERNEALGAWVLVGELRPDPQTTLVGEGLNPRVSVDIPIEDDYLAYNTYEAGADIETLLGGNGDAKAEAKDEDVEQPNIEDRTLQRAVEVLAALQVLKQLPQE